MLVFRYTTDIPLPIDEVWSLFQNTEVLLPALTPPKQKLIIEQIHPVPQQVGTEIVMQIRSMIGRVTWVARLIEIVPPHPTLTGIEARFVDLQVRGPFRFWRHTHEFETRTDQSTRMTDHVEYQLGWGPIGCLADRLVIPAMLRRLFVYREQALERMIRTGLIPDNSGRKDQGVGST
ncbi:MAG: SRPBCC domain-containing protein [Phycisphaerae bacterium]|nr:MAG: SRPBCC domain-containing protein [Phycisphaerae bacterium]